VKSELLDGCNRPEADLVIKGFLREFIEDVINTLCGDYESQRLGA